jgi:hypothetical protein
MKRLLLLILGLGTLTMSVFAMAAYPKTDATYSLPNGHHIKLEFYAPKEALPFFDPSLLVNGFAKISDTYKINEDFDISLVVHTNNQLRLGVFFLDLQAADIESLRPLPVQESNGAAHFLPLIVPRDAIQVVFSWLQSFLANKSADKPVAFLKSIQSTPFFVQYQSKLNPGSLAIEGQRFQGQTLADLKPVFDATMILQDFSTITVHKISLDPTPTNTTMLENAYAFMLDPLDDQDNPGLRTENIFVYWLFGLPPPPPAK